MVSPIPWLSSVPNAVADLIVPWKRRSCLRHAQVQRPVAALCEQFVRTDHDDGVIVLHGDLEVVEAVLLEERCLPDRGLDERLRRRLAVLLHQPLVQGTGVHADADGNAGVGRLLRDLLDLIIELADVARVHAHRRTAGLDRLVDVLGLEVDVRDDRDLGLLRDRRERLSVLCRGAGHAHDVAAGRREFCDLLQSAVDVGGLRRRHGLDGDLMVGPDTHLADLDLPRLPARREDGWRRCGHTQVHCGHRCGSLRAGRVRTSSTMVLRGPGNTLDAGGEAGHAARRRTGARV